MHSIRTQITAITVAAILTSILLVFAVSFTIIQGETDRNSVGMMNLIDDDTQKSLEKYFESIEQSVEIAANIAVENLDSVFLVECGAIRPEGEESAQNWEQAAVLDAYLKEYCAKIQEYFAGVADYTQGVTAYYYCISPKLSETERGFYYRKLGKTGFIAQKPLDVENLEPSETLGATWYDRAVGRGRPCWIGPYTWEEDRNTWICSYFVPIYKAGMLIGLMGMDIPCDTLIAQVENIRVYDTGYVCLLDEDRQVIYHPDLPIGSELDALGQSAHVDMLKEKSSGDELIQYTAGDVKRQMSFSTLSNGLKLVCIAPAKEINAPWIRLVRAILVIMAAVMLLFVAVVSFLVGAITSPLSDLTDASRRLADGDYEVELSYQGKNEIGALTGAFKRMRDQIRKYIHDLNHQLYHDRLTDLPNMRHFFDLAGKQRDDMLAEGRRPVLLFFNVVGLSGYNRQQGFDRGDRLIAGFAGILLRQFGDHRVCRISGDHFAAVTDEERAVGEIQAVLRECETAMDGKPLPIRVGAYPNALEEVDVNVAVDRARFAAELKKGELGSSVTWFNDTMLRQGELYRYITQNLDRALAEGWVKVYYQPIIRAADGKVCDEEALARWIDPELGFLSPGDFIPALEQNKLIYKLDLYVLDQVLEKMKRQKAAGQYVVPQSVNLSRMDFESCDVVEEIRRRVDEAGVARSLITVEITESVIGGDFDFMKQQVVRFRELGFPVWMDDFGSGYSSMNVLQQIRFDLIKFDMGFMQRFDEGDESKIILTELMNMAIGLGMETVCEGVETEAQVEFLREIGCTRIQGYYYGKPMPFEGILSQMESGSGLEYENPAEAEYYAAIGRINLYDVTALANENDESLSQYFNTLPMCIMEVNGDRLRFSRCNRSYRDFLERTVGVTYDTEEIDCTDLTGRPGAAFLKAAVQCGRDGVRSVMDEKLGENTVVHSLVRRVAVNPVTGTAAVAVAVLALIREDENAGTSYSQMARAMASDYVDLFYVDLETEKFIEYRPDAAQENLTMERHGEDFFAAARKDAMHVLYPEDREDFVAAFTKENVVSALDSEGQFKLTYRQLMDGKPVYVGMKAARVPGTVSHILIGVTDVDAQMRRKEEASRVQAERAVYARVSALTQDFIALYTVDIETGHYIEYRASCDYANLGVPTEGDDFFTETQKEIARVIYPEDLPKMRTMMTRERLMGEIERHGFFALRYRLLLDGTPHYVNLKAAMVEEQGRKLLIVGVNDIDAQVRHEQEFERKLSNARSRANLDALTGVKTKSAYNYMSEQLSRQIEEGQNIRYAIVLCRVRALAQVNETQGREAGDQLIRDACAMICDVFKHSPVFRVAGDQFAVIVQGRDLEDIHSLVKEMAEHRDSRAPAMSCGMAFYDGSESVASVFARAERLCT